MKEYEDHVVPMDLAALEELNDNTKFLQVLATIVPSESMREAQLKFLETFSYNYPIGKLTNG